MTDFRWLIEAPGQRYLAPRHVGDYHFHWTLDYNEAVAFRSEEQADKTMMAIRELAPALFDFERTIGNAKAIEHGWFGAGALVGAAVCAKCGCETKGEVAWVHEQEWCHPCADMLDVVGPTGERT